MAMLIKELCNLHGVSGNETEVRTFIKEQITPFADEITVEHDKLINRQLEETAVTSIAGFAKLFPEAVKVLEF
jgi:putative aminopeptidase FrvX